MIALALLLLTQAASPGDIIVTGHRAEDRLAECLASNCPPAREIEASLQASVEQFANGRYENARRTLQSAIRRNRDHASELPGPVSSLYATLATVASHEGDGNLWRSSARDNVDILRRHLGEADPATLRERLRLADDMIAWNAPSSADQAYQSIQRFALEGGHRDVAAGAVFRRGWLAMMRGRYDDASRLADEAVELSPPDSRLMAQMRDILNVRIAVMKGDGNAVDALAARLRQSSDEKPKLLFAPPVDDINRDNPGDVLPTNNRHYDSAIRFADVGYWIRPDGKTADVAVLRNSGIGQWERGIVRHVSARRYVPMDAAPTDPGVYRIDRFTVRAEYGAQTGSRLTQRVGNLTVHVTDLTETDAMADASKRKASPPEVDIAS